MKIKISLIIMLLVMSLDSLAYPIAKYWSAVEQFDAIIKQYRMQGSMPQFGTAQVDILINELTNQDVISFKSDEQRDESDRLIDICNTTSRINNSYLYYGMDKLPTSAMPKQRAQLVHDNIKKYEKELIKFQTFNLYCFAKLIPIFEQRLHQSSLSQAEKQYISTARDNIIELYLNNIMLFDNASALSLNYRFRLLQAVIDVSPQLAPLIPPDMRRSLVDCVQAFKNWDAPMVVKDQINRLLGFLQTDRCDALCRL